MLRNEVTAAVGSDRQRLNCFAILLQVYVSTSFLMDTIVAGYGGDSKTVLPGRLPRLSKGLSKEIGDLYGHHLGRNDGLARLHGWFFNIPLDGRVVRLRLCELLGCGFELRHQASGLS
jgi:hypothetical protein